MYASNYMINLHKKSIFFKKKVKNNFSSSVKIFIKGHNMMYCYGCLLTVHLYCYGIDSQYKIEKSSSGEDIYMFLCDKCKHLGNSSRQTCEICKKSDGGFKKCDNEWVHLICALFNDNYYIENYKTMATRKFQKINENDDIVHNDKKKIHKSQAICDICAETNHLIKCSHLNCTRSAHIYCLLKQRADQERKKLTPLDDDDDDDDDNDDMPKNYWSFNVLMNDNIQNKKRGPKSHPFFAIKNDKMKEFTVQIYE